MCLMPAALQMTELDTLLIIVTDPWKHSWGKSWEKCEGLRIQSAYFLLADIRLAIHAAVLEKKFKVKIFKEWSEKPLKELLD